MKKLNLFLIIGFILMLFGCSEKVNVYGDLEESKIIINEDHETITFHTLVKNDGTSKTDSLYVKFVINDEQLAKALESNEIIFSDDNNQPQSFTIDNRNGYFVSLSYYYNEKIPLEQLIGAVTVIVFDEAENEVTRFTIDHVINENA